MDYTGSESKTASEEMGLTLRPEPADDVPVAPEWPPYCNPHYIMPATIQVMVPGPDGRRTRLPVAVQKAPSNAKPYLGGYRHKKTGYLYHHGATQTLEGLDRRDGWGPHAAETRSHRDTQTCVLKSRSVNTGREHGTQMARKDVLLDVRGDRELQARPYFSSVQLDELKRRTTMVIQCYWRGYTARRLAWNVREVLYQEQVAAEEAKARAREKEHAERQAEIQRRTQPKTSGDFERLYGELEAWVGSELALLKQETDLDPATRTKRKTAILAKQTTALHTIDRLKKQAAAAGKDKRSEKVLSLMAKPKLWHHPRTGEVQEVHTQFTVRAAELLDLYQGLADATAGGGGGGTASVDERLDVLLNVKWTVREFDCALTRDIVDLCDREAEMLNRGRHGDTLLGLRKRLLNLFLQFVETPDFNPEAARFRVQAAGGGGGGGGGSGKAAGGRKNSNKPTKQLTALAV